MCIYLNTTLCHLYIMLSQEQDQKRLKYFKTFSGSLVQQILHNWTEEIENE